jgi:hypothetical protein
MNPRYSVNIPNAPLERLNVLCNEHNFPNWPPNYGECAEPEVDSEVPFFVSESGTVMKL